MTNIHNYSKMKVDSRRVKGVVSRTLKNLRREGFFSGVEHAHPRGSTKRKGVYSVQVVFVEPGESARINFHYRKKRKPTNILSFDYGDEGELVLCPHVIKKEARIQGNSLQFQMAWMIIHGLVHLAGLHHERSSRVARTSAALEKKLLDALGIRQ